MDKTLTLGQVPANCEWSRVGFRLSRVAESDQPETIMVCARERNRRRSVEVPDCANCPHWVPETRSVESYATPLWRVERE